MSRIILRGLGLVLVCVAVSSCGPKDGEDLALVVSEVRQMAATGQVDRAIGRLESYWESRHYTGMRPAILSALLELEIRADRTDAAKTRFLGVATQSPELAAQVVGMIEEGLLAKGRHQELMDWAILLRPIKLGDAALSSLASAHIRALVALGQSTNRIAVMGDYLPVLTESGALKLVDGYFQAALQGRDWELAEALVAMLVRVMPDSTGRRDAVLGSTLAVTLARDGWKAADGFFRQRLPEMTDAGAARNLRTLGAAIVAANELAAADALYEFGLAADKTRPVLREAAAVEWLTLEGRRENAEELIRRLGVLQSREIPGTVILNMVSRHYACLLNKSRPAGFDTLNLLLQAVRNGEHGRGLLRQVDGMLLDISYFREDFETSLAIIERGLVIEDSAQKAMMITKVKAHIALKKGNYKEAIGFFRSFMAGIAQDRSTSFDPLENIRVSPSMILGMNARRIGDLWMKAGSSDEAAKAYAEARQHYEAALKEFADVSSQEHRKILREIKDIPQG